DRRSRAQHKNEPYPEHYEPFPLDLVLARKIVSKRFDPGVVGPMDCLLYEPGATWALVVEKVYNLPKKERSPLLRETVYHKQSEIAAWAVQVLGLSAAKADIVFLESLSGDAKLPLYVQTRLDQILLDASPESWGQSKSRAAMLTRWVSAPLSEEDAELLSGYLQGAPSQGIAPAQFVTLVASYLGNEKLPAKSRHELAR